MSVSMSIRQRIALATSVVVLISLLGLSAGVYYTTSASMRSEVDNRLENIYRTYERDPGFFRRNADGSIELVLQPDQVTSAGQYVQVLSATGGLLDRSATLGNVDIPISDQALARAVQGTPTYYRTTIRSTSGSTSTQLIRVYMGPIYLPADVMIIVQVGESLGPMNATLAELRRNLLAGSALTIILLSLAAWLVTDAAMRPLKRISETAHTIGRTTDLSQRLTPPRTRDDVQQLAETFNEMLTRLEGTFNAERRFVADASHELRTPLTALRANADIMLRQIKSGAIDHSDLAEGLSDIRDEADRMSRLVNNLLTLARADVGWRPDLGPVSVVAVARDVARIAQPLVRGQRFEVRTTAEQAATGSIGDTTRVLGNADQLTQLLMILLDNAFTHAPAGSEVVLEITSDDSDVTIHVRDTGPGIAPEHLRRIFERFFRTDDARARSSGGAGLGLSIARWIVSVHRGDIRVRSERGNGTTFTVVLARMLTEDVQQTLPLPRQVVTAGNGGASGTSIGSSGSLPSD